MSELKLLDLRGAVYDQLQKDSTERAKEKTSFWASETECPKFDLYHKFIGTTQTNPPDNFSLWRFKCGDFTEMGIIQTLTKQGLLCTGDDLPESLKGKLELRDGQYYFRFKYKTIEVSGSLDGLTKEGYPVEVKSYYGDYAHKDMVTNGRPKSNYLKQVATYMMYLKAPVGYVYMAPMPAGEHNVFRVEHKGGTMFTCNNYAFDMAETLDGWVDLYDNHVAPQVEPSPFVDGLVYKHDVFQLDFRNAVKIKSLSKSEIVKMRNGHKVYGDWQLTYSPYKDLWIEKQGSEVGYNQLELNHIQNATQGYTTW